MLFARAPPGLQEIHFPRVARSPAIVRGHAAPRVRLRGPRPPIQRQRVQHVPRAPKPVLRGQDKHDAALPAHAPHARGVVAQPPKHAPAGLRREPRQRRVGKTAVGLQQVARGAAAIGVEGAVLRNHPSSRCHVEIVGGRVVYLCVRALLQRGEERRHVLVKAAGYQGAVALCGAAAAAAGGRLVARRAARAAGVFADADDPVELGLSVAAVLGAAARRARVQAVAKRVAGDVALDLLPSGQGHSLPAASSCA